MECPSATVVGQFRAPPATEQGKKQRSLFWFCTNPALFVVGRRKSRVLTGNFD